MLELSLNKTIIFVHNVFEREVRYGRNSKKFKRIVMYFRSI